MALSTRNVFFHYKGHGSLHFVRSWLLKASPFLYLPMEGQNASGRNRDVVRVGVLVGLAVAIQGDLCHVSGTPTRKVTIARQGNLLCLCIRNRHVGDGGWTMSKT